MNKCVVQSGSNIIEISSIAIEIRSNVLQLSSNTLCFNRIIISSNIFMR